MSTSWVNVAVKDGSMDAFLALPPQKTGPAILLIQEIFGVNAHIRQVAELYALAGYVVLAPDIFWRSTQRVELEYDKAGIQKGIELMTTQPMDTFVEDLKYAAQYLRSRKEVSGPLTAIGYCFGGSLAYLAAAQQCVDASICYYGGKIHQYLDLANQIKVPLLMHYAKHDHSISLEAVASVEKAFKKQPLTQIYLYENAEHGFNCNARDSYHRSAATLALGRSFIFLSQLT